jgi:O-antigen ligase
VLALHITLALFILGYFIVKRRTFSIWLKIIFILVLAWFLTYQVLARSDTGMIITGLTFLILGIIVLLRSNNLWLKISIVGFILLSTGSSVFYISGIVKDYYRVTPVDFSRLDTVTNLGHRYINNIASRETENGNYLYIYIQWDELKDAWSKRSTIPITGRDKRNQEIGNTLVRYLTSKGLRKDANGMSHLSAKDIRAIENGTANVIYTWNFSIRGQVFILLRGLEEYRKTGDPTGSSLMQRLEFWKASVGIIKDHWLTGVGTGDMNEAFQQEYEKMNSKLAPDQRWRSHNQFLSIFVGFGIFGLLWFLFAILYPPIVLGKFKDFFFLVFFIIAMLSMIPEDTIESQLGVTFFALFYSFFLFARKEDDNIQISNVP